MKTVLLIEGQSGIREKVSEQLKTAGYHILFAEDGRKGLAMVREQKPDIILCDIQMPDSDGHKVLHELKNDPAVAAIPVIFLTSDTDKKQIAKAGRGYIERSADSAELLPTIERCLNMYPFPLAPLLKL